VELVGGVGVRLPLLHGHVEGLALGVELLDMIALLLNVVLRQVLFAPFLIATEDRGLPVIPLHQRAASRGAWLFQAVAILEVS
jgi:hypothetical protein